MKILNSFLKTLGLLTAVISGLLFSSTVANAFTVGVAFPTQNDTRWYTEGFMLNNKLKAAGFNTELFFAGDLDNGHHKITYLIFNDFLLILRLKEQNDR